MSKAIYKWEQKHFPSNRQRAGRVTIRLTFGRCYAPVVIHEFAHHLQFCETGDTKDTLDFRPYLIRVWSWLSQSGLAAKIFTKRQVLQIEKSVLASHIRTDKLKHKE